MRELSNVELDIVCGGEVVYNGVSYTDDEWNAINSNTGRGYSSSPFSGLYGYGTNSDANFLAEWQGYVAYSDRLDDYQGAYDSSASQGIDPSKLHSFDVSNISRYFTGDSLYQASVNSTTDLGAQVFVDSHVFDFSGSTAGARIQSDVASFYNYAVSHQGEIIDLGEGNSTTYGKALSDFDHIGVYIGNYSGPGADNFGGANGAQSVPNSSFTTNAIQINVANANEQSYYNNNGVAGIDFGIFHEIGHALNMIENTQAFGDESAANTAGRSMENSIGVQLSGLYTTSNGDGYFENHYIPPGFGYSNPSNGYNDIP